MDLYRAKSGNKTSKKLKARKKKLLSRKIALEKEYVYIYAMDYIALTKPGARTYESHVEADKLPG
jgi:hypothetical protein